MDELLKMSTKELSRLETRQDGSSLNLLRPISTTEVLILDDWMRDPIQLSAAQDLLEVFDDRFGHFAQNPRHAAQ